MKKIYLASALILAGTALNAQSVSGDFEVWRNYNSGFLFTQTALQAPAKWVGLDSVLAFASAIQGNQGAKQIFKSTDMHSGSFAARIVTAIQPAVGDAFPGILTNANVIVDIVNQDFSISGGTAVTTRISKMTVWAKYNPAAINDSATLGINAVLSGRGAGGADSVIGVGILTIGKTTAYQSFDVPVDYANGAIPDHVQIALVSSGGDTTAIGSELFVDDVTITTATGISQSLFRENVVKCYPNPTNGTLYLSSDKTETLNWEAVNTAGQVVARQSFKGNGTINLSGIPAGIYYYRISDKESKIIQTGNFTRQ